MPAVIFDLDGVLVDSEQYWRDGFRSAVSFLAGELGVEVTPPTDAKLHRFEGGRVSDTVRSLAEHFFPGEELHESQLEAAAVRTIQTASELLERDPHPIATNVSVAHELASAGYPLAVASSSARPFIDAALRVTNLAGSIDVRESAYDLEHAKPHPEVYLNALARLGVTAEESVAIEDSVTGATAAVAAGLPTLLVNARLENGAETAAELCREGGRVIFMRTLSMNEIHLIFKEPSL